MGKATSKESQRALKPEHVAIAFGEITGRRSLAESLRANADDRLALDPLGRIEGGNGVVEGRDGADVRPQSSVPHPLDDLTQLGRDRLRRRSQ